ncbi:hypothetical protein Tcan_08719 [Toxocara canis]|uniref:Uncharacterized protein n=1 Tax=Toxocara canis TaxID=6265 RepID=A0A0B2V934_TOXCA|nr:hypothetical protein Tcan_08719 [Toxocara canis]
MESEVKDVWYTDYSGVLACVTSVALFSRCWPIADFFASKLNALFRPGKTEDEEISKLEEELNEERRQLGLLSPTAQFAAYFKKERRVNKLNMQYKALVSRYQKVTFATTMALKMLFISVCYLTAFALMFFSRHVQVGRINYTYLWPFNFLLQIPNINSLNDDDSQECPVSLFAVLLLCNFIWRNAANAETSQWNRT